METRFTASTRTDKFVGNVCGKINAMNKRWLFALLLLPLALAIPLYSAASWRPRVIGAHPFPARDKSGASVLPQILLSPDGKRLLTWIIGDADPRGLAMWDVEREKLLWQKTQTGQLNWDALCFSPDSQTLVVTRVPNLSLPGNSKPLQIELLDSGDGRLKGALTSGGSWIRQAAFAPDGRKLIIVTNGGINVKDVVTNKQLAEIDLLSQHIDGVSGIEPAPDGQSFVVNFISGFKSGKAVNRAELRDFDDHARWGMSASLAIPFDFAPDSTRLLVTTSPSQLEMRDALTGRVLWKKSLAGANLQSKVWLADSSAVILNMDREYQFLDAQTGQLVRSVGHGEVQPFVVAPDGNALYSINANGQIVHQRLK